MSHMQPTSILRIHGDATRFTLHSAATPICVYVYMYICVNAYELTSIAKIKTEDSAKALLACHKMRHAKIYACGGSHNCRRSANVVRLDGWCCCSLDAPK